MIRRVHHVALRARDPQAAAAFAVSRLGMTLERLDDDGSQYLKAMGPDPYCLVYVPGDDPGLERVAFVAPDRDAAAARLDDARVPWERIGDALVLRSPAGHRIELVTGADIAVPAAHSADPTDVAGAPVTIDHVTLTAPDIEVEGAFARDALGLLLSATVSGIDAPVLEFYRAPRAFLFQCLSLMRADGAGLHHLQFSVKTVDDFFALRDRLKADRVELWGPLRHGPGHSRALYLRDAAGYWIELGCEEECVLDDATYHPMEWSLSDPHALDEWTTTPAHPELFGALATSN
jgi:catechol 2,3-dioxygenase-like lactoylglutathione lyase family enzyme